MLGKDWLNWLGFQFPWVGIADWIIGAIPPPWGRCGGGRGTCGSTSTCLMCRRLFPTDPYLGTSSPTIGCLAWGIIGAPHWAGREFQGWGLLRGKGIGRVVHGLGPCPSPMGKVVHGCWDPVMDGWRPLSWGSAMGRVVQGWAWEPSPCGRGMGRVCQGRLGWRCIGIGRVDQGLEAWLDSPAPLLQPPEVQPPVGTSGALACSGAACHWGWPETQGKGMEGWSYRGWWK